jgi:RNA polymerase sigma factor (sigma-70 family)
MATVGDIELLNDYARTKSEAAFATLVDRYLNLVYSAAMRQVRDPDLAKDVSQAVFIVLARKAGRLGPKTILSGWLYRTACFASRDALKADYRRQRREQEAMKMEQEIYSDQALWEELSPVLDEAMQQLKPKDRDAILLRFFEDQSFREVGAALGSNEDAAQKCVSRALDKLRGFLRNRGVTASLIGLGGALLSNGAHAAPFGLKGVVTVGATAGVAGAGGGATLIAGLADNVSRGIYWDQTRLYLAGAISVTAIAIGTAFMVAPDLSGNNDAPAAATIPVETPKSLLGPELPAPPIPPVVEPPRETPAIPIPMEPASRVVPKRSNDMTFQAPAPPPAGHAVATQTTSGTRGVHGKVMLQGTPPPNKLFKMDPVCGRLHKVNKFEMPFYQVAKDGGLSDVVVFIREGTQGRTYPARRDIAVLDQVDCFYTPYVTAIQTGQTLQVRNSDAMMHNVHATPRNTAGGNKEMNVAQVIKGQRTDFTFPAPELFLRFKCDVHQWMYSYVSVVDHPYFAVTDETGAFQIPDLPPGEYILEAVHRKVHGSTYAEGYVGEKIRIEVVEGQSVDVAFALNVPR